MMMVMIVVIPIMTMVILDVMKKKEQKTSYQSKMSHFKS